MRSYEWLRAWRGKIESVLVRSLTGESRRGERRGVKCLAKVAKSQRGGRSNMDSKEFRPELEARILEIKDRGSQKGWRVH